jgi:hypothetical protein
MSFSWWFCIALKLIVKSAIRNIVFESSSMNIGLDFVGGLVLEVIAGLLKLLLDLSLAGRSRRAPGHTRLKDNQQHVNMSWSGA